MTISSVVFVVLAVGLQAVQAKPFPKEPDEPFAIYVFTETPGDVENGDSLGRTTEEVAKRIRDHDKWFRIVETREEADIAVELLVQSTDESAAPTYVSKRESTQRLGSRGPSSTDRHLAAFGEVKQTHTLLSKLHVPKARPLEMNVQYEGRRLRDAAKTYARRLEMFVRQNYWTLMDALER